MENKIGITERLEKGIVLSAEGYIFELEKRRYVKAGPYVPEVVLDYPEALKELHREFLRAGAEVMVALTYYAHRDKMRGGRQRNRNRKTQSPCDKICKRNFRGRRCISRW